MPKRTATVCATKRRSARLKRRQRSNGSTPSNASGAFPGRGSPPADGLSGRLEEGAGERDAIRSELIDAERSRILALREEGRISDDAPERLERALDLRGALLD